MSFESLDDQYVRIQAENKELRRQREALRAVISGMILAIQGRGLPPRHLGECNLTASELRQYAEILGMEYSEPKGKVNANKRADFLDEAVEMGNNILDQTKKV